MAVDNLGAVVTAGGQAIQDLFEGEGNAAQANAFSGAATLAEQNAQLEAASTRIQETQTARQVYQTIGTQEADVAGAGFTESGSALDLLQASQQQGALAKSLVNIQGAITGNAYASAAGEYSGLASAYNAASTGSEVSAIGSIGGALLQGGQLASAGKTVIQGVNYVSDLLSGNESPDLLSLADSTEGLQETALPGEEALADEAGSSEGISLIDGGIEEGAALSDTAVDTSAIPIGTSADAVSAGIGDFLAGAADDVVAGVGVAADAVAESAVAVAGGVGDALETIGEIIAFAVSVICTTMYKYKMISRAVWLADQRYGQSVSDSLYLGYLSWAEPVANRMLKYPWFAYLASFVFKPIALEIAFRMGEPTAKSTFFGRLAFKVFYFLSKFMERKHAYART